MSLTYKAKLLTRTAAASDSTRDETSDSAEEQQCIEEMKVV